MSGESRGDRYMQYSLNNKCIWDSRICVHCWCHYAIKPERAVKKLLRENVHSSSNFPCHGVFSRIKWRTCSNHFRRYALHMSTSVGICPWLSVGIREDITDYFLRMTDQGLGVRDFARSFKFITCFRKLIFGSFVHYQNTSRSHKVMNT
jgi:hypothetical protein